MEVPDYSVLEKGDGAREAQAARRLIVRLGSRILDLIGRRTGVVHDLFEISEAKFLILLDRGMMGPDCLRAIRTSVCATARIATRKYGGPRLIAATPAGLRTVDRPLPRFALVEHATTSLSELENEVELSGTSYHL